MGSHAADLGLDLKLCAAKAADSLLRDLPPAIAGGERGALLEETLRCLEDERTKMDAFKRELPKSIKLVTDVIEIFKEELEQCQCRGDVLEEFIPIKIKSKEEETMMKPDKDNRDKMNWMSSAQLWSDNYSDSNDIDTTQMKKIMQEKNENLSLESESWSGGGAFVRFKAPAKEEKVSIQLSSLVPTGTKQSSRLAPIIAEDGVNCKIKTPTLSPAMCHMSLHTQQQQSSRKARRCWSPELHRRFVLALQQLGGAQVATPKQIRELMKVDGLTNDEVKSHLQKYRLHTRRLSNSSQVNRSIVMIGGGLWGPNDHYPDSSQQSASQSGSPQGPLQLSGSARAVSVTAGDSCEEDGKSESYSWK